MWRGEPPHTASRAALDAPVEPGSVSPLANSSPVVPPVATAAPQAAIASSQRSESEIMQRLRDVGASDPETALALAQEGNERFPSGADAPERASFVVRSLSSLGRHDEARAQALLMELRYPDTDWTRDVHRHMFSHPPNDPSERGYGKDGE